MKAYAAAIAALPLGLVGLAVGGIFIKAIDAIGRNPASSEPVKKLATFGFAVTEAVALIILLIALLILYGE